MADQEFDEQRVYQASLEFWKATFEYFKTFATICLASIAAFAALLAGVFGTPPDDVEKSMFSLLGCSTPVLSWFGTHSWIFWIFMGVLTFVVFTWAGGSWFSWFRTIGGYIVICVAVTFIVLVSARVFWLHGMLIPCLSPTRLRWFADKRSLWMMTPFFLFIAAGLVSLAGTHYCRKAFWDLRSVTAEDLRKGIAPPDRYRRLFWLRTLVWLTYGSATIVFLIIAPLSISL